MPQDNEKPAAAIGPDLIAAALAGPAPLSNRFLMTSGDFIRLAFLEQGGEGMAVHHRAAVTLTRTDAQELANTLIKVLLASAPQGTIEPNPVKTD